MNGASDVVVIGGGVLGCSAAYHLARLGGVRVTVLERRSVGSGASARAAGLMTQLRSSAVEIRAVRATYELIRRLQEGNGDSLGVTVTGSLHVGRRTGEAAALVETLRTAVAGGLEAERIHAGRAAELCPWLRVDERAVAVYTPGDAVADGSRLAGALAAAARRHGAIVYQGVEARSLAIERDRVVGVETASGTLPCDAVVDASGAWSGALVRPVGLPWPLAPVRSGYWVTAPVPDLPTKMPYAVLVDAGAYCAPHQGGLVIGLRERECISIDARRLPADPWDIPELGREAGWRILTEGAIRLSAYMPRLADLPMQHFVAGFSTYTPDGLFLVGEHPGIAGLFVASGCNGAGLAAAGGLGQAVADMVLGRPTNPGSGAFAPDRFGRVDALDPAFLAACAARRATKKSG